MTSTIHNVELGRIVRCQVKDKLYHYGNAFTHLIILQMLGYFISFNSGSSGGTSSSQITNFYVGHVTLMPLYIFTVIWVVVQGLKLAEDKSQEYYMVSNNIVAFCSDVIVMAIYGFIGSITLLFSGFLLRALSSLIYELVYVHESFRNVGILQYLSFFVSTVMYLATAGAAAYSIGILKARFKSRFFLGVAALIVLLFSGSVILARLVGTQYVVNIQSMIEFYTHEVHLLVWLTKSVSTLGLLYCIGYLSIRNMEVNQS
ncbi:MAG: hypothetical protein D5S00_06840 [Tindallia sp. MSAO_Bac2]|nr:MAG: hypothetical protein D5S00_06840 [Tindallia sp. MSAO_Bac2]